MKKLDLAQMEMLDGGGNCVTAGFLTGVAVVGFALAIANPFTGPVALGSLVLSSTAANMIGGAVAGFGLGGSLADLSSSCGKR